MSQALIDLVQDLCTVYSYVFLLIESNSSDLISVFPRAVAKIANGYAAADLGTPDFQRSPFWGLQLLLGIHNVQISRALAR